MATAKANEDLFDALIEKVKKFVIDLYNKNSDNGKTEDVALWAAKQTQKVVDRAAGLTTAKIIKQIQDRKKARGGGLDALKAIADLLKILKDGGASSSSGPSVADHSTSEIKYPIKKAEELGRGTFGAVFRAKGADDFAFAIREVERPGQDADRLKQNIRVLTTLSHDNIVRCYGFAEGNGKIFMYLELLTGSVSDMMKKSGKACTTDEAKKLTIDLVCGLKYLHSRDIVHGSIKCANILLGGIGTAKLGDAGMSQTRNQETTPGDSDYGDYAFWMSPEALARNRVGKRSDIWSLGCTVYEMVKGNPPYADTGILGFLMISSSAKVDCIIHDDYINQDRSLSPNLKSFLLRIFVPLERRPFIASVSTHRWLTGKDGCVIL